jgi:potassium-transporting ATPase KdpC subunit
MKTNLIISLKLLFYFTIITGVLYPILMTILSHAVFPFQSRGSVIESSGNIIGSVLLGQSFDSVIYFKPRPSAVAYNPIPSGATNWGPTSDTLKKTIEARRKGYIKTNMLSEETHVPEDAIFASASGVDPHISIENAVLQSNRVALARNFDEGKRAKLRELINRLIEKPQFGILGEERINVLKLNIELDKM